MLGRADELNGIFPKKSVKFIDRDVGYGYQNDAKFNILKFIHIQHLFINIHHLFIYIHHLFIHIQHLYVFSISISNIVSTVSTAFRKW